MPLCVATKVCERIVEDVPECDVGDLFSFSPPAFKTYVLVLSKLGVGMGWRDIYL